MRLSKILGVPFRSVFSINCPTKFTKPAPQIMHSPSSQFSPKNPTSGRAIHSNSSPAEKAGCGVSVTIPNAVHSRHYIYTIQFTHQNIRACLPLAGQSAARQAPLQHTIKKSAQIRLTRSIGVPFQHSTKKSAKIRHIRAPPRGVRVPFHPIHPDNHGNFHNQTQNLYVRADSIHPYIKVLLTLSKKMKFI